MATLTPSPKQQFFDANGVPLSGGKLYTYASGTTTPLATYTDSGGGTPNANPVILDSRGEASVWLGASPYTIVLKTSADVLIWSVDGVDGPITSVSIHAATSKATPVDADEIPLLDSAASFVLKKVTWANIKTALASTFAALAGSSSQVFSVAAATAAAHAVRADQVQGLSLTAFTTGGTGTAFTLTPTPAITAYAANQTFDVIFSAACGAAPTLAISGVATPPNLVRQRMDGSYANLVAASFPSGWQSRIKLVSATQALVMNLPLRTSSISATRDLTAATGSVAYTGFGGKPRKLKFKGCVSGSAVASIGDFDGTVGSSISFIHAGTWLSDSANTMIAFPAAGAYQIFTVTSLDEDGFTGTWTKTGAPTGTFQFYVEAELE